MKRATIFREEVLAKVDGRLEDSHLDVGLRFLRRLGLGMVAIFVLSFLVICQLRYARKLQVSGVVTQTSIRVVAPKSGVINGVLARDGRRADVGEPLFEISSDRQLANGASLAEKAADALRRRESIASQQQASQQQSFDEREGALRAQKSQVERERAALEDEAELQKARLAMAVAQQAKDEELIEQGFMSRAAIYARKDTVLDLKQRDAELRRNLASNQREFEGLNQALAELLATHNQARLVVSDSVEQLRAEAAANEERKHVLVVAPGSGSIDGVGLVSGDYVVEGQTLAHIFPSESSLARFQLFIPAAADAAPQVGMRVALSVRAYPYQKFGLLRGTVTSIGAMGISGKELSHVPIKLDPEQIYFRAVAQLDESTTEVLSAGMAVDGTIKLEERTVFDWLRVSLAERGRH